MQKIRCVVERITYQNPEKIVGTKKALSYAVHNLTVTNRNTLLKERLMG